MQDEAASSYSFGPSTHSTGSVLLQLHSQNGWLPPCLAAQNGLLTPEPTPEQSLHQCDYLMHLSPLKTHLHLCDALFQHRIEHFTDTHTDVTLRIHTALFYYSISMSHRDPRGFLMSLTWMCILMSAFPISVAPKKVQKGTKKCPHVIPARSNRGLGIWGKSEAQSKSRNASVCV